MHKLKYLAPILIPIIVVIGVVGISLPFGSLMGSRQFPTPPTLTIIDVEQEEGLVEIIVRNNELHPVLGKAWYRVVRAGNAQESQGQPIIFGPVPPKSTQSVRLPGPRQRDLALSAHVIEVIPHVDEVTIKNAALRLLDKETSLSSLQVEIELANSGTVQREYQVSLYVMQVRQQDNSLMPTGETFQSDVHNVSVGARQATVVQFNEEFTLSTITADPYQLGVWVLSTDIPGSVEHPIQITYPDLLRPDAK
jgi:hypothetical protein